MNIRVEKPEGAGSDVEHRALLKKKKKKAGEKLTWLP